MFFLLSPAKNLDESRPHCLMAPAPYPFPEETALLASHLKRTTPEDLKSLMGISDKLAKLNWERYQNFHDAAQYRAVDLFSGDVYKGLAVHTLDEPERAYVHKNVGILSGLYGLVRADEPIAPYRLEMGTRIEIGEHQNLYEFWGSKISDRLNKISPDLVINLASQEYAKAVDLKALKAPYLTCHFKQLREGKLKTIGLLAKRARGLMVRYCAETNAQSLEDLKAFHWEGYGFDKDLSSEEEFVFVKKS